MSELEELGEWLDRYQIAWRSNDPDLIAALFSEDAVYRWHPWEDTRSGARGQSEIVEAWLKDPDEPGTWDLRCVPVAVNEGEGVARCVTRYAASEDKPERVYHNIFLIRLEPDGRCSDFTEFFMEEPAPGGDAA